MILKYLSLTKQIIHDFGISMVECYIDYGKISYIVNTNRANKANFIIRTNRRYEFAFRFLPDGRIKIKGIIDSDYIEDKEICSVFFNQMKKINGL